jgi:hypothetical protein
MPYWKKYCKELQQKPKEAPENEPKGLKHAGHKITNYSKYSCHTTWWMGLFIQQHKGMSVSVSRKVILPR